MPIIQLSYSKLLGEISDLLGVDTPPCEMAATAEGWFLAYVDLRIPRDGPIFETVRCRGVPSPNLVAAEEDAYRVAVQRMKGELGLQIKDANYDDFVVYKNLYDQLAMQYAELLNRFNNLEREHGLLKGCYVSGIVEKIELITEQVRLRHTIDECFTTINRLHSDQAIVLDDPAEAMSSA